MELEIKNRNHHIDWREPTLVNHCDLDSECGYRNNTSDWIDNMADVYS